MKEESKPETEYSKDGFIDLGHTPEPFGRNEKEVDEGDEGEKKCYPSFYARCVDFPEVDGGKDIEATVILRKTMQRFGEEPEVEFEVRAIKMDGAKKVEEDDNGKKVDPIDTIVAGILVKPNKKKE